MGNVTISKTNIYRANLLMSQIYQGMTLVMMINPGESLKGTNYIFIISTVVSLLDNSMHTDTEQKYCTLCKTQFVSELGNDRFLAYIHIWWDFKDM